MTVGEAMRAESERYWATDEAARTALDPRASASMPVHVMKGSRELSRYHYFRFVAGASDDHAIAGWQSVMDGRQRLVAETVDRESK